MKKTEDTFLTGFNSGLDLKLERIVDLPASLIWQAWTNPEHIKKWFCPAPWTVTECELDLRPGGIFRTTMRSPEGTDYPNTGCILEVIENKKFVWTDAMLPGFRPASQPESTAGLLFTGGILLSEEKEGTRYTAIARHGNPDDAKKHSEMGFYEGWNIVLDQLIAHMKSVTNFK